EGFAHRLDGLAFMRLKQPEGHGARPRLARRQQGLDAFHREGECAQCRAFHEGASFDAGHGFLPRCAAPARVPVVLDADAAWYAAKFNAYFWAKSSGHLVPTRKKAR